MQQIVLVQLGQVGQVEGLHLVEEVVDELADAQFEDLNAAQVVDEPVDVQVEGLHAVRTPGQIVLMNVGQVGPVAVLRRVGELVEELADA